MNRAFVMAAAVAGLLGASVMIVAGGRSIERVAPEELAAAPADIGTVATVEEPPPAQVVVSSRLVAPQAIAPPQLATEELQRIEPREALSRLSLALPPKPRAFDRDDGTVLFRPVASAAGSLDAKGYKIVIAGIDPVLPDEVCSVDGRSWPCGVRARTAFRAMLRSRAVTCEIPPEADRTAIVVPCRIGKQDIGEWLVANGWARATAAGPYAEAGNKAEAEGKGVFGPAPSTAAPALPATTDSMLATPPVDPQEPLQ